MYMGDYNQESEYQEVGKGYDICLNIFKVADTDKISVQEAAIRLAQERIDSVGKVKLFY